MQVMVVVTDGLILGYVKWPLQRDDLRQASFLIVYCIKFSLMIKWPIIKLTT